jgi:methyl-accepting chemotaxis protein
MEAGRALTKIFETASQRRDLDRRHVRHQLCRDRRHQSGAVPHQILDWADRALPPFQEAFLARTSAWRSAP